jgi:signal transduction histidine kinase
LGSFIDTTIIIFDDKDKHDKPPEAYAPVKPVKGPDLGISQTLGSDEAKSQAEFYIDLLIHDINNMNQAAMGYLELAMEKVKQGKYDPSLFARSIAIIKNSSELIENVRKARRIKAEGQRRIPTDLGDVLGEVVSEYSVFPGRNVTINYRPQKGNIVLAGELLKDVFSNLVSNSIKHSAGPVTIDIDVDTFDCSAGKFYTIIVADNGPGMPEDLKARVFGRSVRGYNMVKGKGLGLYLVKTLVESYDGSVRIDDRVVGDHKKGCKFTVMLPAVKMPTTGK